VEAVGLERRKLEAAIVRRSARIWELYLEGGTPSRKIRSSPSGPMDGAADFTVRMADPDADVRELSAARHPSGRSQEEAQPWFGGGYTSFLSWFGEVCGQPAEEAVNSLEAHEEAQPWFGGGCTSFLSWFGGVCEQPAEEQPAEEQPAATTLLAEPRDQARKEHAATKVQAHFRENQARKKVERTRLPERAFGVVVASSHLDATSSDQILFYDSIVRNGDVDKLPDTLWLDGSVRWTFPQTTPSHPDLAPEELHWSFEPGPEEALGGPQAAQHKELSVALGLLQEEIAWRHARIHNAWSMVLADMPLADLEEPADLDAVLLDRWERNAKTIRRMRKEIAPRLELEGKIRDGEVELKWHRS
jgi:hypothetical protein